MSAAAPDLRLVTACGTDLAPAAHRWFGDPDDHDLFALDGLDQPVLDVGCGPGRIVGHLSGEGIPALGVDTSTEAVRWTRERGAPVLRRSVFDPLPGTGSWGSAVLLDGNIGIGGDPVALLERVGDLVRPGGPIVVEVLEPGATTQIVEACFVVGGRRTEPFPWAVVGADDIGELAGRAGVPVCSTRRSGDRWFATLRRG